MPISSLKTRLCSLFLMGCLCVQASILNAYGNTKTVPPTTSGLIMTHDEFVRWYETQPAVISPDTQGGSIQPVSTTPLDQPKTLSGRLESNLYVFGPGDIIAVVVQGKPEFSRDEITLNADGLISLPLVGEIKANGKTTHAVTQEITERMKEYLIEPHVSILLKKTRPQISYVLGSVKNPGPYIQLAKEANNPEAKDIFITQDYRLTTALANAGGILEDADLRHLHIFNRAQGYRKEINLFNLLVQGQVDQDLILKPDDIIYVPRLVQPTETDIEAFKLVAGSTFGKHTFQIRIYGKVLKPDVYELKPGEMTLQTVLAKAGGLHPDANARKILIARPKPDGKLEKMMVDSTQVETALQPHDIVLVNDSRRVVKVQKTLEMISLVMRPILASSFLLRNLDLVFGLTDEGL